MIQFRAHNRHFAALSAERRGEDWVSARVGFAGEGCGRGGIGAGGELGLFGRDLNLKNRKKPPEFDSMP